MFFSYYSVLPFAPDYILLCIKIQLKSLKVLCSMSQRWCAKWVWAANNWCQCYDSSCQVIILTVTGVSTKRGTAGKNSECHHQLCVSSAHRNGSPLLLSSRVALRGRTVNVIVSDTSHLLGGMAYQCSLGRAWHWRGQTAKLVVSDVLYVT